MVIGHEMEEYKEHSILVWEEQQASKQATQRTISDGRETTIRRKL